MSAQSRIEALIASGKLDEARSALAGVADEAVASYLEGRIAWKQGRRAEAMTLYAKSAALAPDGAGAVALQQAREIMNFFNKDLYNP